MASARTEKREAKRQFVSEVRDALRRLKRDAGYIVLVNIGPYDHNPEDMPLPDARFPEVFRALYEAVDYAENSRFARGFGPGTRLKIARVTGETVPGTDALSSQIVWRNWTPQRDRGRPKPKARRDAGKATRVDARDLRRGDVITGRTDVYDEPLKDKTIESVQVGRWVRVRYAGGGGDDFNLRDTLTIRRGS